MPRYTAYRKIFFYKKSAARPLGHAHVTVVRVRVGWTHNYDRRGTTHDSYTGEQFARRYAITDKYRRRKDEMSPFDLPDVTYLLTAQSLA